jgi:hypothetical protein
MAQQARHRYQVRRAAQAPDGEGVSRYAGTEIGGSCLPLGPVTGMRWCSPR